MSEHKLRILFDSEYQSRYESYEKFLKSSREWPFEYIKSGRGAGPISTVTVSCTLLSVAAGGHILPGLAIGIGIGLSLPFLVMMSENRKRARELGLRSVRLW